MGLFDKFKDLVGIEDVDEEDEDLEEEKEKEKKEPSFVTPVRSPESRPIRPAYEAPKPAAPAEPARSTYSGKQYTNPLKMVVIEPQACEDSPRLVDSLKAKKPVIINLENLETDVARKIFDFLSGATYALGGNVQKVANNIFVFAPDNVDVSYNQGQRKQPAQEPYKSPWMK